MDYSGRGSGGREAPRRARDVDDARVYSPGGPGALGAGRGGRELSRSAVPMPIGSGWLCAADVGHTYVFIIMLYDFILLLIIISPRWVTAIFWSLSWRSTRRSFDESVEIKM
jgi:hypothetical protein